MKMNFLTTNPTNQTLKSFLFLATALLSKESLAQVLESCGAGTPNERITVISGLEPGKIAVATDWLGTIRYRRDNSNGPMTPESDGDPVEAFEVYADGVSLGGNGNGIPDPGEKIYYTPITVSTDECVPLPVQLLSFDATATSLSKNTLKRTTATETNNEKFDIRKKEGLKWVKIGTIKGSGTTNTFKNYGFEDNNAVAPHSTYKLTQTDVDGSTQEIGNTIEVSKEIPTISLGSANPLAQGENLVINIGDTDSKKLSVSFFTNIGTKAGVDEQSLEPGANTINTAGLPAGTYLVQVIHDGTTVIKTYNIVVQ